jgi:hypothetical protein
VELKVRGAATSVGGGLDPSAAGLEAVTVHPLCWPPWWWVEGAGLGVAFLAQRAYVRSCSPAVIGGSFRPTPDSLDEGHPLPAASLLRRGVPLAALAQVVSSSAPMLQPIEDPSES